MRFTFLIAIIGILCFSSFINTDNWGFFAHRRINRMAVFTLPPEMIIFYKKHIEYITDQAIAPDMRRYASPHEAPRHYINADIYDVYPFKEVPRRWTEAMAKFTDIFVITNTNDTIHLMGKTLMDMDWNFVQLHNSHQLNPSLDSLRLDKRTYLDFIRQNILPQYYQKDWQIEGDSLQALFAKNGLDIPLKGGFAKDQLSEHGILPWHLIRTYYGLSKAFQEKDKDRILRVSAEFGHYVADAHVPLHTTENYNGQLTDQKGIHAFWETRLPELFADDTYDYFVGKADYIDNKTQYIWDIVLTSYSLIDSVLLIEKDLSQHLTKGSKYCFEQRGDNTIRTECTDYATAYHKRMNGMVEKRLTDAIHALGCLWYSAWVDAGQPDLRSLLVEENIDLVSEQDSLKKAFNNGKILGREH